MSLGGAALLLLACNTTGQRVGLVVTSLVILWLGGMLLYYSRKGRPRQFRVGWAILRGEEAKLGSTIFAVILILLGAFALLSQVLYLDC